MYTKEAYNSLLKSTAQNIDISDEMFEAAEKTYKDLGKWIDQETPDYEISIYPQGSFALGTVVRPITNADDYDLDIVCQFKSQYGLTAKELKGDVVKPLLVRYKKTSREIEEKKRCWHVEYDDVPNFHMDVIPAHTYGSVIRITDHNEDDDTYDYLGSNPAGYVKWFFDACAKQRNRLYEQYIKDHRTVVAQADVEDVKRRKVKTPLQRVVQILKRHRDIKFADDNSGNKPISIIITTIAGRLYEEEDNIYDALFNILSKAPSWIMDNRKDQQFYIENPSYKGENFADKWNTHPERATAFLQWLYAARKDLVDGSLLQYNRIEMGNHLKECFGSETGKAVFNSEAETVRSAIAAGTLKVDTSTGNISKYGTVSVPPAHHFGA